MAVIPAYMDVARLTMSGFADALESGRVVVIVPVGAVEPHGPHLALGTDTVISRSAAIRAAERLRGKGIRPLVAPDVPYGVTRCAASFKGAVSVSSEALSGFLESVVEGFLANGVTHVCLVNNHLEPAQAAAVRASLERFDKKQASIACPLDKRWGRTLSDEFKSGACHGGCYETSIMLAAQPDSVVDSIRASLAEVPISLSEKLSEGVSDFAEMGLNAAYAGAPAAATAEHGRDQLQKLAMMISTVITEALAR